jgi:predicted P-loop ATPase
MDSSSSLSVRPTDLGGLEFLRDGEVVWRVPPPTALSDDDMKAFIAETEKRFPEVAAPATKTKAKQPRTDRKDGEKDRLGAGEIQPYIEKHYAPRLNVRTGGVEIGDQALSRAEEKAFHQRMAQEGLRYSNQTETIAALDAVAHRRSFDPVIEALEAVDQRMSRAELLSWWTEVLQLSAPWEAQLWLHWAVGAVEKLYRPGKLLKLCPVLVGAKDLRKSSFVEALALGHHGALIVEQNERDRLIALKTKWIWELSEVEQIKKWGWDKAKDFLARPADNYTPKNSNTAICQARNWCLIGTTNSAELVTDPNAASRLPCFTIRHQIDTDRVRAEAPAMWAGVRALMEAGMTSDLTEGIYREMDLRQHDHQGENPMRDQIEAYLEASKRTEVALAELARFVLNVEDQARFTKSMARELQMAISDLGWVKKPGRARIVNPFQGHPHQLRVTVYMAP